MGAVAPGSRHADRMGSVVRPAWAGWVAAVALLTLAAGVFGYAHRGPVPPLTLTFAVAATAPLLVARRWPLPALGLVVVVDAIFVVWGRLPWPPTAVLAWLLAIAASPLLLRRPHAFAMLVVTEAAVLAAVFVPASLNPRPWDAPITEALAVLLAWGGADVLRSRRESERRKQLMDEELRGLQERAAIARGRAEIARELHDVVAHHVSLIAVRAATAPYQLGEVSEATAAAFTEIATEARAALDDLRAVLGVLRTPDGEPPQAPQPSLADVPELVERLSANGMTVTLSEQGRRKPLGGAVGLCCYRVVQEALTNAARHAPGSPVDVRIDYRDTEIAVKVTDRGARDGVGGPTADGTGFGLIGMRERVAALGGDVAATRLDTGFQVEARVPLQASGPRP